MLSNDDCELTILMPCLNEAETLAACIRKAMSYLERSGVNGEVLVADNGSTDGSQDIAVENGARVVDVPVRGYGAALFHGAKNAKGKYIIMGDSDCSYDFSRLDGFVEALREGFDLVMGNRFQGGIEANAMPWKNRWIGNPILTGIGKIVFRIPEISDFHCGLRGFSKQAFETMDLRTTGMEFASEMVVKASLLKMRIKEIPTTLSKDGRSRPPHLKPWRDGWRHLSFLLLYSPRWLYLYPGLILSLFSFLAVIMLIFRNYPFGIVQFSVNSQIAFSGSLLIGIQSVLFAFLAKVIMSRNGLLPPDPRIDRVLAIRGYLLWIGIILFVFGFSGLLWGVQEWENLALARIDPLYVIRRVVPSVTFAVLGVEAILVRLFLTVFILTEK